MMGGCTGWVCTGACTPDIHPLQPLEDDSNSGNSRGEGRLKTRCLKKKRKKRRLLELIPGLPPSSHLDQNWRAAGLYKDSHLAEEGQGRRPTRSIEHGLKIQTI